MLDPVELHGDPTIADAQGHEDVPHLGQALRRGEVVDGQPDALCGPGRFRSTGHQGRVGQRGDQRGVQIPGLGRLEPGPHADARVRDDEVGRGGDQRRGRVADGRLVPEVGRPDGGTPHDARAAADEQLLLLAGAPIGGDADREALERCQCHGGMVRVGRFPGVSTVSQLRRGCVRMLTGPRAARDRGVTER